MAALSLTFEKGFRDMRDLLPVSINFGPILREKKKVLPFNLEKPDTHVRSRWGKKTVIWANVHREKGIWVTRTENHKEISNRTGDGISKPRKNNTLGNGIWAKLWARKMEFIPSL